MCLNDKFGIWWSVGNEYIGVLFDGSVRWFKIEYWWFIFFCFLVNKNKVLNECIDLWM